MDLAQNRLVALLSRADQRALRPLCTPLLLEANWIVPNEQHGGPAVYFLTGASVALINGDPNFDSPAIGLIDSRGAVGLHFGLGHDFSRITSLVQTTGIAWSVSAAVFRRLLSSRPTMLLSVSRYMWTAAEDLARFSASMRHQTVLQNLACWIYRSRSQSPTSAPRCAR